MSSQEVFASNACKIFHWDSVLGTKVVK